MLMLLQVLLRGTAAEMVVDVACLDTAGTVIAHLPAVRPRLLLRLEDTWLICIVTAKVAYQLRCSASPLCKFVPADNKDYHT